MEVDLEDINRKINASCDVYIRKAAKAYEEEIPPEKKAMVSSEAFKERFTTEAKSIFNEFQLKLQRGIVAIIEILKEQRSEQWLELNRWFNTHTQEMLKIIHLDENSFPENHIEKTLQEQIDFPKSLLEVMYFAVLQLDEKEAYEDALGGILFCLIMNPKYSNLWFVYGTLLQKTEKYEASISAFQMAKTLSPYDPYIYSNLARSWAYFKKWDEVLDCINWIKGYFKDINMIQGFEENDSFSLTDDSKCHWDQGMEQELLDFSLQMEKYVQSERYKENVRVA